MAPFQFIFCWTLVLFISLSTSSSIPQWERLDSLKSRALSDFTQVAAGQNGACTPAQQARIALWVSDTVNLCRAAIQAIDDYQTYPDVALTMAAVLGVPYYWDPVNRVTPTNPGELVTIKGWFQDIITFVNGGAGNFHSYERPWVFCGSSYLIQKSAQDAIQDENGNIINHPTANPPRPLQFGETAAFLREQAANPPESHFGFLQLINTSPTQLLTCAPATNAQDCWDKRKDGAMQVANSPQCMVTFAVAMSIFYSGNPANPASDPTVFWLGTRAMTRVAAWTALSLNNNIGP
ncbi:hypothetical protein B0J14DRAFT_656230 [Halenospora varia]|nr:hypothetical protein B0J14DRAFT_656230 [Halenospora varia]